DYYCVIWHTNVWVF
nr:immunoglobulin light chain junction region [Macaca mulatta]MOY16601.1 immunoglobulin light chain junction region [Macaca mulatta]